MYTVGVITASDLGAQGKREDLSGKMIQTIVEEYGYIVKSYAMLPDEKNMLKEKMIQMADEQHVNLILTTGGTGFSQRDITPEATLEVIEKPVPGIAEAIRNNSFKITRRAILSRGISGIRGQTLIINLPGSPKAVKESLIFIIEELEHGINILTGDAKECGGS
jgi:molybdenum cofactor synthesis domain-containing protein